MVESVRNWRARILESKYAIGLTEVEMAELIALLYSNRKMSDNTKKSLLEKLVNTYKAEENPFPEGQSLRD